MMQMPLFLLILDRHHYYVTIRRNKIKALKNQQYILSKKLTRYDANKAQTIVKFIVRNSFLMFSAKIIKRVNYLAKKRNSEKKR